MPTPGFALQGGHNYEAQKCEMQLVDSNTRKSKRKPEVTSHFQHDFERQKLSPSKEVNFKNSSQPANQKY
jgi:hypothetical protein